MYSYVLLNKQQSDRENVVKEMHEYAYMKMILIITVQGWEM